MLHLVSFFFKEGNCLDVFNVKFMDFYNYLLRMIFVSDLIVISMLLHPQNVIIIATT